MATQFVLCLKKMKSTNPVIRFQDCTDLLMLNPIKDAKMETTTIHTSST